VPSPVKCTLSPQHFAAPVCCTPSAPPFESSSTISMERMDGGAPKAPAENVQEASYTSARRTSETTIEGESAKISVHNRRIAWLKIKHWVALLRSPNDVEKPRFEILYEKLKETEAFVLKAIKNARSYLAWQQRTHTANMQMVGQMYTWYQHQDAAFSPAREDIGEFWDVCNACDQCSGESFKFYEKQVIEPIDSWLRDFAALQPDIDNLRIRHLVFQHYRLKLQALTEASEARARDGKQKAEQRERLSRNGIKTEKAKALFEEMNASMMHEMEEMYKSRFEAMSPAVSGHVQFHRERTEAFATKRDRIVPYYNH